MCNTRTCCCPCNQADARGPQHHAPQFLQVGSTQACCCAVGGIIGFALIWAGKDGVIWARRQASGAFPPYSGLVSIVLAWFIAPILTGLASSLFFIIIRTCILRRKQALQLSFWLLPLAVLATSWVNVYFVLTKVHITPHTPTHRVKLVCTCISCCMQLADVEGSCINLGYRHSSV